MEEESEAAAQLVSGIERAKRWVEIEKARVLGSELSRERDRQPERPEQT